MDVLDTAANDSDRLLALIHGFRASQAIYVIVMLGIPDLLGDGSLTCGELARQTATHPRALYRVLRALAAAGLVHEEPSETFSLTPVGNYLRTEVRGSRAAWVKNAMQPSIWRAWEHLLHTLRTGEAAFTHVHSKNVWEFRAHSLEDNVVFHLAMREGSLRVAADLLSSYDFAQFRHIMDVGGGDGTLLATLLKGCPGTNGTLFDQPHVLASAPEVLQRTGVKQRCNIVAGSFFDIIPAGANAYLMKFILHDWDDDHCMRILANCRRAMPEYGRLLIIERILGPANEGLDSKLSDLNMMVNLGGQERSEQEFSILIDRAGFSLRRIIALPGGLALLEVT